MIPQFIYEQILKCHVSKKTIAKIFSNGTPLSKGHGRIIDESKITSVEYHTEILKLCCGIERELVIIDGTDAPTVVEADKEQE